MSGSIRKGYAAIIILILAVLLYLVLSVSGSIGQEKEEPRTIDLQVILDDIRALELKYADVPVVWLERWSFCTPSLNTEHMSNLIIL
jgi:hypothetical protein